jgi:hypothetical protein
MRIGALICNGGAARNPWKSDGREGRLQSVVCNVAG